MSVCQGCGTTIAPARIGRPRKWCSERCRKRQYAGTCVDCGAPTNGYNGRASAGERCLPCSTAYQHANAYWTPERITQAIQRWAEEFGRPPTANEWNDASRPEWAPSTWTISTVCGSWNAAVEAAGFTPCRPGEHRRVSNRKHARRSAVAA